jgi:hypothetical protein
MINIHNGHYGSYHNSPHPELQALLGSTYFPDRDLFGEVVDALKSHNLKVLVYFSAPGFDWSGKYVPNVATKDIWNIFPTEQALDWMTRVMNAGGFYTWAVERTGGLFAAPQFNQLLEMDAKMEQ